MELIFNEISAKYLTENDYEVTKRMQNLCGICKKAKEHGFSNLRVEREFRTCLLKESYTIENWLNARSVSHIQKQFFLSYLKFPYIEESDENAETTFIEKDYYLNEIDEHRFNRERVEGLAVAYIYDTIAVSFPVTEVWKNFYIKLIDEIERIIEVKHVSLIEHFEYHKNFIDSNKEIILQETALNPSKKGIKLRDDHGKDILKAFAKKLINSCHVIGVINSLPFNSKDTIFIRKIYPDGKIEMVLFWTERGYGLIIQTTGRNLRETEAIAKILEEKYCE
ncbi:hypothetical protein QUF74_15620 [Candidatus Halobeggiatoa sp. HSG11]|nr:hypothetical protein [Candidatus Halobeggiatoa sp. HSG11]